MSGCAGREWFGSGGSAASLEGPSSRSAAGLVHRGRAAGRDAHPAAAPGQRVRLTSVPMTWRPARLRRSRTARSRPEPRAAQRAWRAPSLGRGAASRAWPCWARARGHTEVSHAPPLTSPPARRAAPLTHTPPAPLTHTHRRRSRTPTRAAHAHAQAPLTHTHKRRSRTRPRRLSHPTAPRPRPRDEVTPEYRIETADQNPCSHHHASQTELCRLVDHTRGQGQTPASNIFLPGATVSRRRGAAGWPGRGARRARGARGRSSRRRRRCSRCRRRRTRRRRRAGPGPR